MDTPKTDTSTTKSREEIAEDFIRQLGIPDEKHSIEFSRKTLIEALNGYKDFVEQQDKDNGKK